MEKEDLTSKLNNEEQELNNTSLDLGPSYKIKSTKNGYIEYIGLPLAYVGFLYLAFGQKYDLTQVANNYLYDLIEPIKEIFS